MAVIKVPKTPKAAFNPNRMASGLIQAQIQHLEAAAGIHPAKGARRAKPRSEGASADYIAELTARIYERAGAAAEPEIGVPHPPPPIAGTATPTSSTRQRRAASGATPRKARAGRSPASGATRRASAAAKRRKPAAKRRVAAKTVSARGRGRRGRA